MDNVVARLMRYAKVWSESDYHANRGTTPSTDRQFDMARLLVEELNGMGVDNAFVDDTCYVYASLPATPGCEHLPVIGLIAHMDTTPDMTGKDVKPQVLHYEGGDLVLNQEQNIVMKGSDFPELQKFVGQDLVCSDGTTLLGADDKAGIAEILTLAEELMADPSFRHGPVQVAFTPDEEIGRGADLFDVAGFGADYAFTMDGGAYGELEYENFNAASMRVTVKGLNIHPGSAKNKMKNAMRIAMEFEMMLPAAKKPEYTAGYEGFLHLDEMGGTVEDAFLRYILRDHDSKKLEEQKRLSRAAADFLNAKYGPDTVTLDIRDSYRNMVQQIEPHRHLVDNAMEAMRRTGVEPVARAIRGGTDGARLSFMGLPCPNLGTGGGNFHGKLEYCCIQEMDLAVQCMKNLVELYSK